jgi:adenylosuccinate lyase
MAVLAGSLGKIATDLSLMAQGEIAELAEPSGKAAADRRRCRTSATRCRR